MLPQCRIERQLISPPTHPPTPSTPLLFLRRSWSSCASRPAAWATCTRCCLTREVRACAWPLVGCQPAVQGHGQQLHPLASATVRPVVSTPAGRSVLRCPRYLTPPSHTAAVSIMEGGIEGIFTPMHMLVFQVGSTRHTLLLLPAVPGNRACVDGRVHWRHASALAVGRCTVLLYQCLHPSSPCHAACPALQKPEAGEQPAEQAAASTAAPAAAAPAKPSGSSGGKKGKGKH